MIGILIIGKAVDDGSHHNGGCCWCRIACQCQSSFSRSLVSETWWATLTSRGHHTKPHLPPLLKAETRLARPLAVSGTSSAEWKQRNSELVQIAEEPKRAK